MLIRIRTLNPHCNVSRFLPWEEGGEALIRVEVLDVDVEDLVALLADLPAPQVPALGHQVPSCPAHNNLLIHKDGIVLVSHTKT